MEYSIDYNNTIKEFINNNIITNEEYNNLDMEMRNISISTGNIQINGETEYNGPKYKLKSILVPNSNYSLIKNQILKVYKLLSNAINKPKIKTIFLIGHSHLSIENYVYLSNYTSFDTINPQVSFGTDLYVYNQLKKMENIKLKTFEQTTYSVVSLVEDGNEIVEKEQTITDSIEDREYTFDLHLALLSYIFPTFKHKIQICPIWINIKSPSAISSLAKSLSQFYAKEDYFFIFSTNLTHFGKLYDFMWDDKLLPILQDNAHMQKIISEKYRNAENYDNFNSYIKTEFKEMLRNEKKKDDIMKLIQILDRHVIEAIKNKNNFEVEKLTNIVYCKEILLTLVEIIKDNRYLNIDTIGYEIIQCKMLEEMRDMNFVSLVSMVFYEIVK